jgi:hypothetical protein
MGAIVGHEYGSGTGMDTFTLGAHWKATNGLYLHYKFQVHQKIIASTVAYPK